MAWIWSDELAVVAESAGIGDERLTAWRSHPVAFALPADGDVVRFAGRLLEVEVQVAGESDTRMCSCGERPRRPATLAE